MNHIKHESMKRKVTALIQTYEHEDLVEEDITCSSECRPYQEGSISGSERKNDPEVFNAFG